MRRFWKVDPIYYTTRSDLASVGYRRRMNKKKQEEEDLQIHSHTLNMLKDPKSFHFVLITMRLSIFFFRDNRQHREIDESAAK